MCDFFSVWVTVQSSCLLGFRISWFSLSSLFLVFFSDHAVKVDCYWLLHVGVCYVAVTNGGEQDVVFGGRIQNFRNYLLIASVQKDDSGTYKCHAVNIKGEDSAQAQLTVISTLFAALVM